ncbi:hypothetical protein [Anaeromicrobium sediminis]|uniref:Uncharacterized protein n=1 Tax=Anaeromicrobium sediminis TaxID=1478221 RepID=A0A267MHQ2_9FIRM|nr:hypothetical protein [Anaeromicrobium sediminis]PAB59056.1 hypothetical protein CCE28_12805 [Anaeromicrobium sediminis]
MNKTLKKIITVILSCSLLLGNTAFANEVPKKNSIKTVALPKLTHSTSYKYSFENYLEILPFKLNEEDEKRARNIFEEIDRAFTDGEYTDAEKLIEEFYSIVDDYWISEKTLKVLLPFDEMITSLGKILTPEQKVKLEKDFDQLNILRNRKDMS